jgi:hypothetical protein
MTTFPGSPKLERGYLCTVDQTTMERTGEILFQYNPDTLTRRLTAQTASGTGSTDRSEVLRLKGPPEETISLEIEIDATDQLEAVKSGSDEVVQFGIAPALAALEVLLYPRYEQVSKNEENAAKGVIEIIPLEAPLTLFVWGKNRSVPVRLTSFNITEEAFDPQLNPIRAKVSLEMQVLTYYDLGFTVGRDYIAYHQNKEKWAQLYRARNRRT